MPRNEGDPLKQVIVCSPKKEFFEVKDKKSHNITLVAERDAARKQHAELKKALEDFGSEVADIAELPGHPNSVFTRDTAVCTPRGFIRLRMGLPSRAGEALWMAEKLLAMGILPAGEIIAPGTAEGGDIILAGRTAFIGASSRTNAEGIRQLKDILGAMAYEVRAAAVPKPYLHIGGAMSMLGPDRVLCCRDVFPEDFFRGYEKIEIPASDFISGNVICLGNDEVIADSSNTEAINRLEEAGITVHVLDLSEFVKGTGGPSCLIMPVDRAG